LRGASWSFFCRHGPLFRFAESAIDADDDQLTQQKRVNIYQYNYSERRPSKSAEQSQENQ
jgi:hypothetical protein